MGLMDRIVKCCRQVFLGGDQEDHQTLDSLDTFLPMSFANAAKHKIFIVFVMSVTNCYNDFCVICQDFFTLFNYLPLIKNLCLFENLTKTEQIKKL